MPSDLSHPQRQAELEAQRASSWAEGRDGVALGRGTRSAPEIFFGGVNNLASEPKGWFFGKPSPLYSNVAIIEPPPPEVSGAQPDTRAAVASKPRPGPPPPVEASGRIVPTSTKRTARKSRRARAAGATQAAKQATGERRVPPSTPEELELARSGQWSYGAEEREQRD